MIDKETSRQEKGEPKLPVVLLVSKDAVPLVRRNACHEELAVVLANVRHCVLDESAGHPSVNLFVGQVRDVNGVSIASELGFLCD